MEAPSCPHEALFEHDGNYSMSGINMFQTLVHSPLSGAVSSAGIAADDRQNFAGDVAGAAWRCEENKGGRDFFRLRRPLHRRLLQISGPSSRSRSAGLSGVQTGPGATAFTRMPLSIRWVASERTKAWMPPLVME